MLSAGDNGLIQNNTFNIINGISSAINLTAINIVDPTDYAIDANIPNNIQILDNEIINQLTTTTGDWVSIYAGKDITFKRNTIRSDATIDDNFLTMATFSNSQVTAENNLLIAPSKVTDATNGTWAFNIRRDEFDIEATYNHNTIIMPTQSTHASGDSCIGYFDNGIGTNTQTSITANYNLCYHPAINTGAGNAFTLNWVLGSSIVTFSDSFNGIWGFENILNDNTSTFTSPSPTNIQRMPIFKDENLDPTDNYELNPISSYLDINGTSDIGAFPGIREPNAIIDQNCTVDYLTCHSKFTYILEHTLKSNDTVQIASGLYNPFTIPGPISNILINGSGPSTILNGAASLFALRLNSVTNSEFSNFSTNNSNLTQLSYNFTTPTFSTTTQDYDNPPVALFLDNGCSTTPISGTTDISGITGIGTDNLNLFLINFPDPPNPDLFITAYVSNSLAADEAGLNALCGVPLSFINAFVPSIFQFNSGNYTYNSAAVIAEGLTTTALAPEPTLNTIENSGTGLFLVNSSNNLITNLTSTNNQNAVNFQGNSTQNRINNSNLTGNLSHDLVSSSTGDNNIENTQFNFANTLITATGNLEIFFNFLINARDQNNNPLNSVNLTISDFNNNPLTNLTTNPSGDTPLTPLLKTQILTQTNPTSQTAGNLSPFNIQSNYNSQTTTTTQTITQPNQLINLILNTNSTSNSPSQASSVGAGGPFGKPACSGQECQLKSQPQIPIEPTKTIPNQTPTEKDFFTDIAESWARNSINNLARKGIAKGHPDQTFRPESEITRAEFAAFIYRAFGKQNPDNLPQTTKPAFPDINPQTWYNSTLEAAKQQNLIQGYVDNFFRPDQSITGAEALKIILHSQNHEQTIKNLDQTQFPESEFPNHDRQAWYANYLLFAQMNYPNLYPLFNKHTTTITRALAAEIIDTFSTN